MSWLKPISTSPFAVIGPIAIFGSGASTGSSFKAAAYSFIYAASVPGKTNPSLPDLSKPFAFNRILSFFNVRAAYYSS